MTPHPSSREWVTRTSLTKGQPVTPIWEPANDTLDGNLTASVLTTGTVINTPHLRLTPHSIGCKGNATPSPVMSVVDTTAPIITRTGDENVTHEAVTSYSDLGASASDTLDGNLTANVLTTGTVDINTPGTYALTYTVSDAAGNAAISVTRNVTVVDTTANDHANGDQNVTHEAATSYTDLGATANDTLDGNLTANVVTVGTVDINTPGTYTLTYTVSDAAGNAATLPAMSRWWTRPLPSSREQVTKHHPRSGHGYTDQGATASDTLNTAT